MAKKTKPFGEDTEQPTSWDDATDWERAANGCRCKSELRECCKDDEQPWWSWDCGFKLDYDGPMLTVSSRFYPPRKNKDGGWEGDITLFVMGKEARRLELWAVNLDELKKTVDLEIEALAEKIRIAVLPEDEQPCAGCGGPKHAPNWVAHGCRVGVEDGK